jgi:hypothetical protein
VFFTGGGVSNRQVTMQECEQRALFTRGQETSVQETNGGEKILRENFQDFYQRVGRDGFPVASCQLPASAGCSEICVYVEDHGTVASWRMEMPRLMILEVFVLELVC